MESEEAVWELTPMLLAAILDLLRLDYWRNSDEKKRGEAPEPIRRPGVGPRTPDRVDHIEVDGMEFAEADEWLAARRAEGKL